MSNARVSTTEPGDWIDLADRAGDGLAIALLWSRSSGRVKVVAFTNDMAHWFGAGWPDRFPELAHFDEVLEAAKLGPLKPDPAAFRRAAEAIGEPPERCLFVDDLAGNLSGAQSVGMATLLFDVRDPQRGMRALLRRLV
jgi:FMN phosphatase YigB (HAD superfamily)